MINNKISLSLDHILIWKADYFSITEKGIRHFKRALG